MDSISDSIYQAFKERATSPVSGVFVIVWLITNWQFLLFLALDERTVMHRMETALILYSNWTLFFWVPVGFTLFYLLLNPFAVLGAFYVTEIAETKKRKIRFKFEENRPFTPEEKKQVFDDLKETKAHLTKRSDELSAMTAQHMDYVLKTKEIYEELQTGGAGEEQQQQVEKLGEQLREAEEKLKELTAASETSSNVADDRFQRLRHYAATTPLLINTGSLNSSLASEICGWIYRHIGHPVIESDSLIYSMLSRNRLVTLEGGVITPTTLGKDFLRKYDFPPA